MGTVRVEHCPDCGQMIGEGMLYEHQQRHCPAAKPRPRRNTRSPYDVGAGSGAGAENPSLRRLFREGKL